MKRSIAIAAATITTSLCLFASLTAQDRPVMTPPKIINIPNSEYPPAAKAAGLGGDVYVLLLIDKKGKGKVKDAFGPMAPCSNLADPLVTSIRDAAVAAAEKATFAPAIWKGKPAEMGFRLKYFFDPEHMTVAGPGGESNPDTASVNIVNGRAIDIPKPKYPGGKRGSFSGVVNVEVVIFEDGKVHFAGAVSGHPDLRGTSVEAACNATFEPWRADGKPIRMHGTISYGFNTVYRK